MTFNSFDELKKYILSHSKVAIELAQNKVAYIINHFLTEYYNEFPPLVYIRTYQLLNSLVKTDIKSTGNGWVADVYFDLSALDYSKRVVPPQFSWGDDDNTYHRDPWDDANTKWVLDTAMTGGLPHGGAYGGTAIWVESMKELSKDKIEILKKALLDAGIPVK